MQLRSVQTARSIFVSVNVKKLIIIRPSGWSSAGNLSDKWINGNEATLESGIGRSLSGSLGEV